MAGKQKSPTQHRMPRPGTPPENQPASEAGPSAQRAASNDEPGVSESLKKQLNATRELNPAARTPKK